MKRFIILPALVDGFTFSDNISKSMVKGRLSHTVAK